MQEDAKYKIIKEKSIQLVIFCISSDLINSYVKPFYNYTHYMTEINKNHTLNTQNSLYGQQYQPIPLSEGKR